MSLVVPIVMGKMAREVYWWNGEKSLVAIATRRALMPKEAKALEAMAEKRREKYELPQFVTILEPATYQTINVRDVGDSVENALTVLKGNALPPKELAKLDRWVTVQGDAVLPLRGMAKGSGVRMDPKFNETVREIERAMPRRRW